MDERSLDRLQLWKSRFYASQAAYENELARMDRREALYAGTRDIEGLGRTKPAGLVRNVIAELVESQVSAVIPQPKVTALRPQDRARARVVEDLLRNLIDYLPTEYVNDRQERTTYIQGGALTLVEWDSSAGGHDTAGELRLTDLHPKKVIPQDGVCDDVEDMDYLFVILPQTKRHILARYGVNVQDAYEDAPDARGGDGAAEDVVTQILAYYRNDSGGIGVFSWVNDTVVADLEDYQARRGAQDGGTLDYEALTEDVVRSDGTVIPAGSRLPYYKPDVFPVVLRRNVSVFGRFLGDSDVDKIEGQQETLKKLDTMILEKLLKGGSILTLPRNAAVDLSDEQLRVLRLDGPQEKGMIDVYNLQPDIQGDLAYAAVVYEQARQIIGITDSFQGRRDTTATSGVAKEFSARQSAGRLESKRAMKDAAWARVFEVMFKFMLAYADEPRVVMSQNVQGERAYTAFNRYDFLERDALGEWRWNDRFLFSTDASATLTANREGMWAEARTDFGQGCYGDPNETDTLILFWTRMEQLHYPDAGAIRAYLEEKRTIMADNR